MYLCGTQYHKPVELVIFRYLHLSCEPFHPQNKTFPPWYHLSKAPFYAHMCMFAHTPELCPAQPPRALTSLVAAFTGAGLAAAVQTKLGCFHYGATHVVNFDSKVSLRQSHQSSFLVFLPGNANHSRSAAVSKFPPKKHTYNQNQLFLACSKDFMNTVLGR